MASIHAKLGTTCNRIGCASLPDMAPFAGLIFLLVCFFMLSGRTKNYTEWSEPSIVTLEQLPASLFTCSKGIQEPNQAGGCVIGLNTQNQYSFSHPASETNFQSLVIQKVAARHQVQLTSVQIARLAKLPYLACDVESLPRLLDAPAWQQSRLIESGYINGLDAVQLTECIAAAQNLALKHVKRPIRIYLKVDADVAANALEKLTDMFQAHGINRYHLLTQGRE